VYGKGSKLFVLDKRFAVCDKDAFLVFDQERCSEIKYYYRHLSGFDPE